ncbi:MAG: C-GCAxxG-C-C family protein [Candidatus Kariarchaeaceae archaeon]|jgi:C_GCAxxG_C_C family probable redox protein
MAKVGSDTRVKETMTLLEGRMNCAQAIFAAYGRHLGVDRDTCLKITSLFGGGINRTGNVCGAVTGAIMAIGLKHGEVGSGEQLKSLGVGDEFIKKVQRA